jgi:hypothetical protein
VKPTLPFPRDGKHRRLVAVWDALGEHGPLSSRELGEVLGVSRHTVNASVRLLRAEGVLRIVRWERCTWDETLRSGGGRMAPVHAIGRGSDAPMPRALTVRERGSQWYRRNRARVAVKEMKRRRAAGERELVPAWLRGLR